MTTGGRVRAATHRKTLVVKITKGMQGLALGALLLAAPAWTCAAQGSDAHFKQVYSAEWAWRTGQAGISTSG